MEACCKTTRELEAVKLVYERSIHALEAELQEVCASHVDPSLLLSCISAPAKL